ncbi:MAG: L-2-hydroxyglutarate oxidase [Woeseiaceae bacterium]
MYDFAIIGGGIVGLSTACQLQERFPGRTIVLLEKENAVARHQTSHNSGVIHAGIYYAPGSLKAQFCKEGAAATMEFCDEFGIPYEQCGKLIVATNDEEHERMLDLYERARLNDLDVELIDGVDLKHLEPDVEGIAAIHLKTTGIVDFAQVCEKMAEIFKGGGGIIRLRSEVTAMTESRDDIVMETSRGGISARYLIVCGGLMADRLARMLDLAVDFRIIPYRGEYFALDDDQNDIVRHLIYPVPDPDMPFLGIHLTRMIDGAITVGPNVVQAFKREGYGWINFSPRDTWELLRYPGFWKVSRRFMRVGLREFWNSIWKPGYLKQAQKYCPSLDLGDLKPHPAGVRAQAVDSDGTLLRDFLFGESPRSLHVCNAPSPAATSSIPIGNHICDLVEKKIEQSES